jgi:hypothetical protein
LLIKNEFFFFLINENLGAVLGMLDCAKKMRGKIRGADDKLGQFLDDQDIEASAYHRNVLRHSLESCPSLV